MSCQENRPRKRLRAREGISFMLKIQRYVPQQLPVSSSFRLAGCVPETRRRDVDREISRDITRHYMRLANSINSMEAEEGKTKLHCMPLASSMSAQDRSWPSHNKSEVWKIRGIISFCDRLINYLYIRMHPIPFIILANFVMRAMLEPHLTLRRVSYLTRCLYY